MGEWTDGSNSMTIQLASLDLIWMSRRRMFGPQVYGPPAPMERKVTLSGKVSEIAGRIALNISA
jgi:hypothetical protein